MESKVGARKHTVCYSLGCLERLQLSWNGIKMCIHDEAGNMGAGVVCLCALWVFCPVAWKSSRNTQSGKRLYKSSSLTPRPSLRNSRTVEKADFSTKKASPAEQEILFPSLY